MMEDGRWKMEVRRRIEVSEEGEDHNHTKDTA
jgi:hypothetical protein